MTEEYKKHGLTGSDVNSINEIGNLLAEHKHHLHVMEQVGAGVPEMVQLANALHDKYVNYRHHLFPHHTQTT